MKHSNYHLPSANQLSREGYLRTSPSWTSGFDHGHGNLLPEMYTTLLLPFSSREETVHPGDYYLSFLVYAAVEYIIGVLTGIQNHVQISR